MLQTEDIWKLTSICQYYDTHLTELHTESDVSANYCLTLALWVFATVFIIHIHAQNTMTVTFLLLLNTALGQKGKYN